VEEDEDVTKEHRGDNEFPIATDEVAFVVVVGAADVTIPTFGIDFASMLLWDIAKL
jgi:hypothetical protein